MEWLVNRVTSVLNIMDAVFVDDAMLTRNFGLGTVKPGHRDIENNMLIHILKVNQVKALVEILIILRGNTAK